ncbi:multidrug efflux SMR transporter [Intrasporangium sp.]|uniref:DMT family transporter n=1 Tax=Intrasporangium sp. TaxID=1925024 RepID=UPI00293A2FA6|nr:multidrug efflux SMR transporter [Intrasporangium sp.]MDV3222076.1 multidrug efflux SMR transporter [Intrasporangium sp.]
MPWLVLLASAVLEAVWATALGLSDGLSRSGPTAVFTVALVLSMLGLAVASRTIPIGTAYAVWTGIGAALTVAWAVGSGAESASTAKILLVAGIIGAVIGLKRVGHGEEAAEGA